MLRLHATTLRCLLVALICCTAGLLPLPAVVRAQDTSPQPPPPPLPNLVAPLVQVEIERHAVDAVVTGQLAQVQVTQVLRNPSAQPVEGVYLFPLPADAAVSDFMLTVDGAVLEGRLLDQQEARRIYEQIVRRQRDPALLEYLDRGLFQTSVFPIPPGATRTVEFTYAHVIDRDADLYHFNYPLSMRGYAAAPVTHVDIRVDLRELPGLRTIYSPNYPITIERKADDAAVITYQAAEGRPASEFDLYFGTAGAPIGVDLLSYKPADEDGFFVLLAAPAVALAREEVVARDIVVVLDTSGSMRGQKMEQAVAAVEYIVGQLNPADRFNLIAFSTGVSRWAKSVQRADPDARDAALAWVNELRATGSTDINRALLEALAQLDASAASRPAYILFLTDGQPTQGEMDASAIIRNALNNLPAARTPRLFTFGVGYDVNTDLLDVLAAELRGSSQYVAPDAAIDEAVSNFYARVSTPVLADIDIDFGADIQIEEVYPHPLPDLFAGEQLVAVGRYREGATVEVSLAGQVNGDPRLYVYPGRELAVAGGDPFVARLWATRKIGHLLGEIRRSGPAEELIEAIIDLSLRYGVITPYTAYLVLEPDAIPTAPGVEAILPGVSADAEARYARGAAAAADLAAAPAAGESAVAASQARNELQQATTLREGAPALRYAGGRTFTLRAYLPDAAGDLLPLWVDTGFDDAMTVKSIEFGSDAYFALLDAQPGMAQWLAVSPEMVIVTGENRAVRITTLTQE